MLFLALAINKNIIKVDNDKVTSKRARTSFISLIKVMGALERPNDITSHS